MNLGEAIAHAEEVAETVSCKECTEDHRQLAEWLKDYKRLLEQEPCDDAISRKATLEKFKKTYFDNETVIRCAELVINGMPPVNLQEPKTGHWIDKKCSACGCKSMLGLCIENYCANCGAKMQEV